MKQGEKRTGKITKKKLVETIVITREFDEEHEVDAEIANIKADIAMAEKLIDERKKQLADLEPIKELFVKERPAEPIE